MRELIFRRTSANMRAFFWLYSNQKVAQKGPQITQNDPKSTIKSKRKKTKNLSKQKLSAHTNEPQKKQE